MAGKDTDPMIDDFGFERYEPMSLDIDDRKMTPVQKALRGVKTGAKEAALSKTTLNTLVRAAMPSGIRRTYDTADEALGKGSELYNSLNEQLSPEIARLKRNARKLMPQVRDKLPNPLAKAIDNLLKDTSSPTYYGEEYDPDKETIKGAMRDVFEAQRIVDEHNRNEDAAKQVLADRENKKRSDIQVRQLDTIREGILRLANYQDTVARRRDQKLLELQYRQYFTQRDLLAESRNSNQLILTELNALVSNSSLPDIAKLREYEKQMKAKGLLDRAQGRIDDYIDSFKTKIGERLTREAKRFGTTARLGLMGINTMAGTAGGGYGPSWQEQAGEMAGEEAVGGLASMLGSRAGRMLRKIPGVANLNSRLDYFHNNAPELINEWAKKRSTGIKWGSWRKPTAKELEEDPFGLQRALAPSYGASQINFLKSLIPKFREGTPEFSAQGYGNNREVVTYDELSRKSVVEIIPGLLQRILTSVDGIRTGDDTVDKTVYDHSIGQFVSGSQMRKSVSKQLMPNGASEDLNRRVEQLTKEILGSSKITNAARKALKQQLLHDMILGRRFNPVNYANPSKFDQISDPKIVRELSGIFNKRYLRDGELKGGTRAYDKLNALSTSYQSVRKSIPKFDNTIEQLLDSGNRDVLHELGVLKRDGKRDFLDPNFIANAVFGLGGNDGEYSSPQAGDSNRKKANRRRTRGYRGGSDFRNRGHYASTYGMGQGSQGGATAEDLERLIERLENATQSPGADAADRAARAFQGERGGDDNERENNLEDIVDDVYVRGESNPRMTRAGIRARRYICKTTNKVIESLNDIKGPVVDTAGRMILDAGDALKGLSTASGKRLDEISRRAGEWADRGMFIGKLIGGRVSNIVDQFSQGVFGLRGRIDDVYVLGQPDPVITGTKMREGIYLDKRTQKPIKTIDDIKGPVIDIEGNVVLTDEDYEKGLYLKDGTLIRRSGLVYNLGRFTNWYFGGYYRNLWKLMKKGATLSKNIAMRTGRFLLGVPDVYVPGEDSPRLLSRLLRRGMYLSSKTGKRIYRMSQIDSDVLGPNGEVVLTLDEARNGLVDKYGKPVRAFLPRFVEKAWDITTAPARLAARAYAATMRKAGNMAASGLRMGSDVLGWGFDKLTGFRKGSWEERRQKKEEERLRKIEAKAEKKKAKKEKPNPILTVLLTMAAGLKLGLKSILDRLNPLRYLKDIRRLLNVGGLAGDLLDGGGRGRRRGRGGRVRNAGRAIARGGRVVGQGLATAGRVVLASAAGEALVGAGTAAMSGLGTAAAALGSGALAVLTSPITLGVAAVVAVGFGAWWAWKKWGASPDPIQQVRLSMYGVEMGDRDTNAKVLKLEESLADYAKAFGGSAQFTKALPMPEIYEMFDIDVNNKLYKDSFDAWLTKRFRPVFLKFLAKGQDIRAETKVHEQDDKIDDGDKPRLAREARFSSEATDYPYNIPNGPNPPAAAVVGTKEIDEAIAAVEKKFARDERKKRAKEKEYQRRLENAGIPTGDKNELKEAASKLNTPDMRYATQSSLDKVKSETSTAKGDVNLAMLQAGSTRRIDELAGVRLRTYGLVELDKERTDTLLTLESDFLERVIYESDGTATADYVSHVDFETYAPRFSVSINDYIQKRRWIDWYEYRFIPAVLSFATAVRAIDKAVDPKEAWQKLKADKQVTVANAIISTQSRPFILKVSIWTLDASPWTDYELNLDSATTKDAIDSLKAKVKTETLTETRETQRNPDVGNGQYGKTSSAAVNSINGGLAEALRKAGYGGGGVSTVGAVAPYPNGTAGVDYSGGGGGYGGGDAGGNDGAGSGTFGSGTGGVYQQLPDSKGNGWENNKDLIYAAAAMTGADPRAMALFSGMESGWVPGIKAADGASTATGLYQFIKGTWDGQLKLHAAKYGVPMNASRTDPKANAVIAGEFMKDNHRYLKKLLGREPTLLDIYMSHFFGPAGVKKWINMPGNAIAADTMTTEAAANRHSFYADKGKGRAYTKNEMEKIILDRFNGVAKKAGVSGATTGLSFGSGNPQPAAGTPTAQSVPAASVDNRAPLSESQLPAGKTDAVIPMSENDVSGSGTSAIDPSAPGGYGSNSAASVPAAAPEPTLSPVAEQAVNIPTVQPTARSVQAQPPKVEQVTTADLQSILGKQLQTQIEQRDLLASIYTYLQNTKSDQGSSTASGNDKSADIARRTTTTGGGSGANISMRRTIAG